MLRLLTNKGSYALSNQQLKRNTPFMYRNVSTIVTDEKQLKSSLLDVQVQLASQTVPWFLKNMPAAYFRAISSKEQLQHLNAITALTYAQQPELMLRSQDKKVFSYIRSGANYPGLLANVISSLPASVDKGSLARVKVFTALDDTLSLEVFRFGEQMPFTGKTIEEKQARDDIVKFCNEIQSGKYKHLNDHPKPAPYFETKNVDEFLSNCNSMYVKYSSPRRLASQIALFAKVKGTEGVVIDIEHGWESRNAENKFIGGNIPQHMITIASANVLPKSLLQKAAKYLGLQKLNILRAHLDTVKDEGNGHVAMTRILVSSAVKDKNFIHDWEKISNELKYLKWIDDKPLQMALQYPDMGIDRTEVVCAYAHMLHGILAKKDPFAYSLPRIFEVLENKLHIPVAKQIADLFLERFDPKKTLLDDDQAFLSKIEHLRKEIRRYVETEDAITLFNTMVDAVQGTLRTNKFIRTRYALALRMDPKIVGYGTVGKEIPYGVFFVSGRRFKGFHVRFRDIARGGLRMVAPITDEQHAFESSRQYAEAYNLAFAQQLKNKDIPEGGSKAVVLVQPNEKTSYRFDRDFIIRKSVKAFSDALLDLNTTDMNVKSLIKDFYKKDELIYLGPDENIIPQDIIWMTKRAAYRGYPISRAFISSKPDAGINHKVYGVTSEGVAVFCDVALRTQGIDPKKNKFTVKITGGTDGDVAGNMIKILHREYGNNFSVVGICDGTAVVENPSGLDIDELLRLVDASLPLAEFNPSKVGNSGTFHKADNPEGIRARNSMHNRVKSDLFVPAGGRPNTINENNWQDYFDKKTNKPSSPLIVEGANLFITPEARQLLFQYGKVVIVKDSSANKCGVICSSYEIISSMLLETSEFLNIKKELVDDVLVKLRHLARVEAELLFREYKRNPYAALPQSSERISKAIIRLHDAIINNYSSIDKEDKKILLTLITEHLPRKLAEVAIDRVEKLVPNAYIQCIIASNLASKIVYREGLQYTESLPDATLSKIALKYLKQEKSVQKMIQKLNQSNVPNSKEMADLLIRGGVRAGVETV